MATQEERFAEVVLALVGEPGVTPPAADGRTGGKFGASGLKAGGKIFAMLSSRQEFVVKLPAARVQALVAAGLGQRFDPGHSRQMKEWLALDPASDADWLPLAREALEFVGKTGK